MGGTDRLLDIADLIANKRIVSWYQPIVSIDKQCVMGVEALTRGMDIEGNVVMPLDLFSCAAEAGLSVELDRLCREKAIENFAQISSIHQDLVLFLNLDSSIIDRGVVGSGHLIHSVEKCNIRPERIVIEIAESKVINTEALKKFVQVHKEYGFLIALDDLGQGCSNLSRILHIKPNIIKIDREMIQTMDRDYYKQELFFSMVGLARRTGAIVVAEGIETQEEALVSIALGADLLQGYYFARPKGDWMEGIDRLNHRIGDIAGYSRQQKYDKIHKQVVKSKATDAVMGVIYKEIDGLPMQSFSQEMHKLVNRYTELEYLYILDWNGMQVTESIERPGQCYETSKIMFSPTTIGSDQSLMDYYLFVKAGVHEYCSDPYLSKATGRLCVTKSVRILDNQGASYILCADFRPTDVSAVSRNLAENV